MACSKNSGSISNTTVAVLHTKDVGFGGRIRRGFKRCSSCGAINAQRTQICRNLDCTLRKQMLLQYRPFDPIQLITYSIDAALYSVRSKEHCPQPRNFVQITDVTLALEHNAAIVSRKAICFVDTCKYDARDATNITCKHVKACRTVAVEEKDKMCDVVVKEQEEEAKSTPPLAEIYAVEREVLWNLNIGLGQKQRLWAMYKEEEAEEIVPSVQRLNASTFVVKCDKTNNFPAGLLHVHVLVMAKRSEKKPKHACACKKIKIIVEPDNSVVMQEEICDHLLLVLAAILSKADGKRLYASFVNALKSFWMPTLLNTPLPEGIPADDALFDLNINIGGNNSIDSNASSASNDVFIFDNQFLSSDNIPDFPDSMLKSIINLPELQQTCIVNDADSAIAELHFGDPNFVSSCSSPIDLSDVALNNLRSVPRSIASTETMSNEDCETHIELSDCNIELMDQFQQLTDQIDLCSDDIAALPIATNSSDLFQLDDDSNIMASLLAEDLEPSNTFANANSNLPNTTINIDVQQPIASQEGMTIKNSNSLLKRNYNNNYVNNNYNYINNNCNNNASAALQLHQLQPSSILTTVNNTLPLPTTIEMPTITVVRKQPLKASEIVKEVRTRTFPHIPAKRPLIVNSMDKRKLEAQEAFVETGPALAYSAWLDHVIEVINESVFFDSDELVKHSFHVHEEMFAHFSKSFSTGVKRRMPNSSVMVKVGKYKGLIKYTWFFGTATTVQRIFKTKNLTIELERSFEKQNDGYIPYVPLRPMCEMAEKRGQRIYPKLELYVAHIWFECNNNGKKSAFRIEWLPNVFPKSNYGILNIEFSLGFRDPTHNQRIN